MSIQSIILALATTKSSATKARENAIRARLICPFCKHALVFELRTPRKPSPKLLYNIHCFQSKNTNRKKGSARCDFDTVITKPEKDGKLPTDKWLYKYPDHIQDNKCPKCSQPLYLRIWHRQDGKLEYYEICRNYKLSKGPQCDHKIVFPVKPEWYSE